MTKLKIVLVLAAFFGLFLAPVMASAAPLSCPAGQQVELKDSKLQCVAVSCTTANISNCDLITNYVNPFVRFLSAFVGLAVTISIAWGGIEYAMSGGDPQKASQAKNRIRNAIIALITFFFLFALLNFLIPGGIL